jgi:acetylornithine deacetylase/succinyl-diaminopimelate desuccinylase-like protein
MEDVLIRDEVATVWANDVVPALKKYIELPALSPAFDAAWESHGDLRQAVELLAGWAKQLGLVGASVSVRDLPNRTPVIVVVVPASDPTSGPTSDRTSGPTSDPTSDQAGDDKPGHEPTVLMYGHLDKQPEMEGWLEGLSAWTPVIADGKLYGRGGADDGYALFAGLTAIRALRRAGGQHARVVLVIEASEESGSPDLGAHVKNMEVELGRVDLVVCLDSGCATYDRLWTTTSLRGLASVEFTVSVLTEGVHSGAAGGVVPSSFRVARALLDRLEDPLTGELKLPELAVAIPPALVKAAADTAELLGEDWAANNYPWIHSTQPHSCGTAEHLLERSWRAAFEVIGVDGIPNPANAGNVLRPRTTLSLALRLPPTVDVEAAVAAVTRALTTDVPHHATVDVKTESAGGWASPDLEPWLCDVLDHASQRAYGQGFRSQGEGGTIPFMGMLARTFPQAQFAVAGVLGPGSNAHGPNEFLHLDYAERLTVAVALILDGHAKRNSRQASS